MTTVYEAIMKAADHIERNPGAFNFMRLHLPNDHHCGTAGCAIGWIGHFSGMDFEKGAGGVCRVHYNVCKPALGVEHETFYARMNELGQGWTGSASMCVSTLRKYAEKYHGHEQTLSIFDAIEEASASLKASLRENRKRDLIPAGVREIFAHTYTAKDLTPHV